MIITRVPLRITFVGGGTDMREFFEIEPGAVVNAAIDKYVYVTVNRKFDPGLRVKYSRTENATTVDGIEHPLFREALRLVGVTDHVEVTSHADIPSRGSGLGSSSAFLVALLLGLFTYRGQYRTLTEIARLACHIERDILRENGGYQDPYIAAHGGLRFLEFDRDTVRVSPIALRDGTKRALEGRLLLFYTGVTRKGGDIQAEAVRNMAANLDRLRRMKGQAIRLREELERNRHEAVGSLLHEGWMAKRALASGVTSAEIDESYERALAAGARGGKLLGAGGGGFLLFYVPEDRQAAVKEALFPLRHVPFRFESEGAKVIYVGEAFTPETTHG